MFIQIVTGSALMLISILSGVLSVWGMEIAFQRFHDWLMREPHRTKLLLVVMLAALWVLAIVTAGVWVWALAFYALAIFDTMEASVYFALVSFTTLGYGDVLLPKEWRILGGMAAANGLLTIGLLTAILVETLRHVRLEQVQTRRSRRKQD